MTKKSNTVELVSGFGKIKSCRGIYTVVALIITHLFVVSSRQRSIMIGEDVKNKFVAYCFIWNLAELHKVKV